MDFIAEIRRRYFISDESISSIALSLNLSRTTCQFDWSEELVELGGIVRKIKAGHFRLCYSHKMFVVAYPCETQEMVLDAHNRAFMFF